MATVNDVLQADSFAGNANLGGANAPAIQIDTKPLQQLALYTQFYHKTLYDQSVADRDAKIKEIADVSKIDLNNVWGKDKDEMTNDLNNLKTKAAEYARNGTRTVQDELDWQTSIGDVMNKYNSAKQRAASYQTQLNDINSDPTRTGSQKEILLKALNDKFDSTDISTPISAATGYKPVNINLPDPVVSNATVIKVSGDKNLAATNEVSFFNPLASAPIATNAINGVSALLNSAKGVDKDLQATSTGEAQTWAGMKDALNAVLATKDANGKYKYFDDNNKFQYDKFKLDNASNTAIMQPVDAMMGLTNYSTQHQNELKQGVFSDNGVNYNAPSTISPDTFAAGIINITPDGVQANQLALAGMYAKYTGDKNDKKLTKLGLGIEQQNANSETSRANLGWANLALDKDKWKASQATGTETMKSSALEKAHRIYSDMSKLADKNGVISPDKVRQLNVEQLKYLGTMQPTEVDNAGVKTQVAGFKPLDLKSGKQYAIQLVNGEIKVLEGDKITQAESGSYKGGSFNPNLSSNVANIATNILNEELKNAGSKELNTYAPVDVSGNSGAPQQQQAQPVKKEINAGDVHTRAAAAGYSDKEYRDLLIKNGVKIIE